MATAGRKLLSSLVYTGNLQDVLDLDLFPELFRASEVELFEFIYGFMSEYGQIPSPETVEEKLGEVLAQAPEPPKFYMDEVENRYLQTTIKKMLVDASNKLQEQDPEQAYAGLMEAMSGLTMHRNRNQIVDFREAAGIVYEHYVKTKAMEDHTALLFGWPTLDEMTGGLRGGDMCSIVGRPASGKTMLVLAVAQDHWMKGGRPLVVSMEMTNLLITQRLAAMDTSTPLTQLLKGELSTKRVGKLMASLEDNEGKEQPFWLIDGNLATTVDDLILLCRQLKPTAVFVDGAYLMRHPNPRAGKWDKLTDNAEWLKQKVATDLNIPVVCSYQFNREAAKKKKGKDGEKAGLEDIYGTDAIAQLSSVVLGLFEHEGIEQQKRRRVDVIKGRNGETGEFLINWDFVGMEFNEVATITDADGNLKEDTANMQFLA